MGIESVLIEKNFHISSGGVSGLSIGMADYLHVSAGFTNLCIKALIFGVVYYFGGTLAAYWTLVGAAITGVTMWLTELTGVTLDWPQWLAFGFILVFAKLPIGLLVSKGYSIGGFTAIAQLLERHRGIPLPWSLTIMNLLAVLAMLISHGLVSGMLTAVIALSAGIATKIWSEAAKAFFDQRQVRAPMFR